MFEQPTSINLVVTSKIVKEGGTCKYSWNTELHTKREKQVIFPIGSLIRKCFAPHTLYFQEEQILDIKT